MIAPERQRNSISLIGLKACSFHAVVEPFWGKPNEKEGGVYKCQGTTGLPLTSKHSKRRQQRGAHTNRTHKPRPQHLMSTISQALITVGCSVSRLVCQHLRLHTLPLSIHRSRYTLTQLCLHTLICLFYLWGGADTVLNVNISKNVLLTLHVHESACKALPF